LVFCAAKEHAEAGGERPPYPWAEMKGNVPWLRGEWSRLPPDVRKNIYIYYVTDHPSDAEHHWIPSRPI